MAEEAYPEDYGDAPKMPEDRFNKVKLSVIQDMYYFELYFILYMKHYILKAQIILISF